MTLAALSEIERAALKAVGSGALPPAMAEALQKSPIETAVLMGKLQSAGLVDFNLTTGYTLTALGAELAEDKIVAEASPIAHRSVGARMPVAINLPDAGAAASNRKIEKLKGYADQRARTRERLRQLAQETIGQRRPLRTLRD
jgi:hypothetical protein